MFPLVLMLVTLSLIVNSENIVIETQLGRIQGNIHRIKDQQIVYSFKGIQYGISPIGSLRFRPSSMNESKWDGIYNGTIFGSTCLQSGFDNEHQPQSEDCLFLNIWTPKPNKTGKLLPVMMWIHGGAWASGSGSASYCNGVNFVGKGKDFVYVSINYRLGIFGFFANEQLYNEDPINWPSYGSQNGLYDQIIALKWINKYIIDYGGNASEITIFGESAGGLSVCTLAIVPLAKGLFERGIIESGACNGAWGAYNMSFGLQQWQQILKNMGYPNNITYLRSISAQQLQANMSLQTFVASVDGYVLTDIQSNIYTNNLTTFNMNKLIIGTNSMDGIVAFPWHLGKRPTTDDEYKQFLKEFIPNNTSQQELIYTYYYPISDFGFYEPDHNSYELAWFSINSDVCLWCPSISMTELINKKFGNDIVYMYQFGGTGRNNSYYAGHGCELYYVFDTNTEKGDLFCEFPWDQTLSNAMISSWTNFGKFMKPNITDNNDNINIEWNLYDTINVSSSNVMIFRDKIEMKQSFKENYRNNVCQFWYNEVGVDSMNNLCLDGNTI